MKRIYHNVKHVQNLKMSFKRKLNHSAHHNNVYNVLLNKQLKTRFINLTFVDFYAGDGPKHATFAIRVVTLTVIDIIPTERAPLIYA